MNIKSSIKKTAALFLCLVTLCVRPVRAAEIAVEAPSAVLVHSSGKVLFSKNAHERRAPASVTKIMTLLLAEEAIDRGSLSREDIITASAHAASMGGSQIWLKEGEQLSVSDIIKCITVVSANDCSVALAEHIAGSEEAFVSMMNERAAELGMKDTCFVNCCGLEAEGHFTTVYDTALMALELLKHEDILDYTRIWTDTVRNGEFGLTNTNKMIRTYEGMTGLKTGFTSQAGYCLAGSAERDGMELVSVVFGGESSVSRNRDTAALLNRGFAEYTEISPVPDSTLVPVKVKLGKKAEAEVRPGACEKLLIRKNQLETLEKKVTVREETKAPVKEGERLGSLDIYSDGKLIANVPIEAAENIGRKNIFELWADIARKAFMRKSPEIR